MCIRDRVKAVVEACKEKHITIRIGVNSGSIEKDILEKYGKPTAQGMIESAQKHIDILESLDFHDYAISLKSVSYTHLDVYKRQHLNHMTYFFITLCTQCINCDNDIWLKFIH